MVRLYSPAAKTVRVRNGNRMTSRRGVMEGHSACTVTYRLKPEYSWTLFGPYARERWGPLRTGLLPLKPMVSTTNVPFPSQ
jgi:hypothetical protein